MSKPSSTNPSNCVRDLIQQQLAAWEGAEVICIEVPTINFNRNLWAFAALPLIFVAGQVRLNMPRGRLGFYLYYPVHLAVLWGMARLL